MCSLAMSIFLYACETWTITADIERRIQALEMRCFHKLLGISYTDCITNEEVKARTGNATGPHEDFLTSVKRCKLKWYGHVTWSYGLAKTILQGTVQGGRRRGRQWKWWEDNIKEWTGLEWNIILRKAENRKEWRKLVVKSTVVPQWSARLQDRWDDESIYSSPLPTNATSLSLGKKQNWRQTEWCALFQPCRIAWSYILLLVCKLFYSQKTQKRK